MNIVYLVQEALHSFSDSLSSPKILFFGKNTDFPKFPAKKTNFSIVFHQMFRACLALSSAKSLCRDPSRVRNVRCCSKGFPTSVTFSVEKNRRERKCLTVDIGTIEKTSSLQLFHFFSLEASKTKPIQFKDCATHRWQKNIV